MEIQQVIKLWKDLNIESCEIEFNCGGDSMGDLTASFTDNVKHDTVECKELQDYFEDAVYNHVQFYVNSDGHYQGEHGTVTVTLNEDDLEEPFFDYSKNAQSEWSESCESVFDIKLPKETAQFVKDNISNINGGDGGYTVNFKKDLILSDKEETLLQELQETIEQKTNDFSPDIEDGELDDWFTFTTNSDQNALKNLTVKGNNLKMCISNSYTIYKDSED